MNDKYKSKILTLPNIISIFRILLTPVFVWLIINNRNNEALLVFLAACLTDALDGFIARVFNLRTSVGVWLDPIGDKLLLTSGFVVLSIPSLVSPNVIPLWLTVICVGRDVLISLAAIMLILLKGPTTFFPSLLGKISTVAQVATLVSVLVANYVGHSPPFLFWLYYFTAFITLLSGLDYTWREIRRFKQSTVKNIDLPFRT